MRKVIGGLCIFIVAMQVLIGVPLAVCCAFFLVVHGGSSGQLAVDVHAGPRLDATIPPAELTTTSLSLCPPANTIPEPAQALDHPILETRAAHGSPLAGTVLAECVSPCEEQQQFVAALEKAADQTPLSVPAAVAAAYEAPQPSGTSQLLCHLYAMAQIDEQAGAYQRADQWRGLARELRGNSEP